MFKMGNICRDNSTDQAGNEICINEAAITSQEAVTAQRYSVQNGPAPVAYSKYKPRQAD